MTQTNDTKTLELPHPTEKIWHALTQPPLIEEWLMKNDFKPVVGHRFDLRADWGVVDCQVLAVESNKTLSYTWDAYGLKSVVTWTLTPTSTGTHLRMEQSGFPPDQPQYYQGRQGRRGEVQVAPTPATDLACFIFRTPLSTPEGHLHTRPRTRTRESEVQSPYWSLPTSPVD